MNKKPDLSSKDLTKRSYKKTKLGWIPEEWELLQFKNVFDFVKSYSFSRNDLTFNRTEGKVYYIHYGDIHSKFKSLILNLDDDNSEEIPLLKLTAQPEGDLVYLKEGDLVIADASEDYEGVAACIEIGGVAKSKTVIAGTHTFVARDKVGKTVNKFRPYILKNWPVAKQLMKIATGISVYGISKTNLSKVKIPIPPLPEQKKIAEILSTWDEAIQKMESLIQKKDQLKRGLMQQLLTGKKRFDGFEGEWREVRFKDLVKIDARSLGSKTPPDFKLSYISLSDIENGAINSDLEIYSYENAPSRAKRIVTKGDILMATVRPNLQAFTIADSKHDGVIASTGFAVLTPKAGFNIRYLYHYLFSHHIASQIHALTVGSNYPAINSSDVKKLKVKISSDENEIDNIESLLTNLRNEIKTLRKHLDMYQKQKKGLMQQLLTGKTRVNIN